MGEGSKPKSLTDDIEKLFDLVKEGASYLLHFYLYFFSKTFPLEFIENLFDHHKENSSYDFSKDGKTYIYRLFNCIYEVEKQAVAWSLQSIYSYIPLPFVKHIYENFCVNNNLECTDVKLKKCKKALINSTKDTKKKQDKKRNTNEDEDIVSRPFPLFPPTPKPKIENTVSVPLSIKPNSRSSVQDLIYDEFSPAVEANIIKAHFSTSTVNLSEESSSTHLNINKSNQKNSENNTNIFETAKDKISLPVLSSSVTPSNSKSNIIMPSMPSSVSSSISTKRPSKIPIKLTHSFKELTNTKPPQNDKDSVTAPILYNQLNMSKLPNDQSAMVSTSIASTRTPDERKSLPAKDISTLPHVPKLSETTLPVKLTEKLKIQNLSDSIRDSSKLLSNIAQSTPFITNPLEKNTQPNTDMFSNIAKVLGPPGISRTIDNSSFVPNPFTPEKAPSDPNKPSASSSTGRKLLLPESLPMLPTASTFNGTLDSMNKTNVSSSQDLSKSSTSFSKLLANGDSSEGFSTTFSGNNIKTTSDLSSDLAKTFDPPAAPSSTDVTSSFPNPFASKNTQSDPSKSFSIPYVSKNIGSTIQDSSKSNMDSSKLVLDKPPTKPFTTIPFEKNMKPTPDLFSDLAKKFTPPVTSSSSSNSSLFPNPFAPKTTPSDSNKPSIETSNERELLKVNITPVSDNVTHKSTFQDMSKSNKGSLPLIPDKNSPEPFTTISSEKNTKPIPNAFPDLANLFNPASDSNNADNLSLFPDLFVPTNDPSNSKQPVIELSNEIKILQPKAIPTHPSPSESNIAPVSQNQADKSTIQNPAKSNVAPSELVPKKNVSKHSITVPFHKRSDPSKPSTESSDERKIVHPEVIPTNISPPNFNISHVSANSSGLSTIEDSSKPGMSSAMLVHHKDSFEPSTKTSFEQKIKSTPNIFAGLEKLFTPPVASSNSEQISLSKSDSAESLPLHSTPPNPNNTQTIPAPLSDLAKIFNPPAVSNSMDNSNLFSNLLSPKNTSDSSKSSTGSSDGNKVLPPKSGESSIHNSKPSNKNSSRENTQSIPDPFSDLAKLFNPPEASSADNIPSLFSNPFATTITPSDSKTSSFPSNPSDIFSIPVSTSPQKTLFSLSPTVPSTFQSPNTKADTKGGESVAPVSKKIVPSIDAGNAFEKAIEQNNKAMNDFGKSLANAFSGGSNAPVFGPNMST